MGHNTVRVLRSGTLKPGPGKEWCTLLMSKCENSQRNNFHAPTSTDLPCLSRLCNARESIICRYSTRSKDAGIALRNLRGRILFYIAGSRNGLEGVDSGGRWHKKKLYPRKIVIFVIEKSVEDVKQDEKSVPDLVELIMKPSGLVKEELRRSSSQMDQFRPEITKIRVSTFWRSGKSTDSRRMPTQPSRPVCFNPF